MFITIGASRTGKGTLLAALHGTQMKYFKKDKKAKGLSDSIIVKSAVGNAFMAPVDANGMPAGH